MPILPAARRAMAAMLLTLGVPIVPRAEPASPPAPIPAPLPPLPALFPPGLADADRAQIEHEAASFAEKLKTLRAAAHDISQLDRLADAEVFYKGVVWALRYQPLFAPKDAALLHKYLRLGEQRAEDLLAGAAPWTAKKGKGLRGFISAVDGSTQSYGIVVPDTYDGAIPTRLDVVLHGAGIQHVGLSALGLFAERFEGDRRRETTPAANVDYIEVHPLGRIDTSYRWAGETDVFEAIAAACRNYRIDPDRIVLRGMSMGASGTWHLGLQHPDRFVAMGPYAGYVDTHRFSLTPNRGFAAVGPLPCYEEATLHLMDAVDYAANASVIPVIAAIGEKDPFFQTHVIMGQTMAKEGLTLVNLISPGTGHMVDPVIHAEQMRRLGGFAAQGIDHAPLQLRFVTRTLKFNRCFWFEALALGHHYDRAEVVATAAKDGSVEITNLKNVTEFALYPLRPGMSVAGLRIGGNEIDLSGLNSSSTRSPLVFAAPSGKWICLGSRANIALHGKRPGLQGPIDDAFSQPFLCVRGTGQPWNPKIGSWAEANLRRFAYEWPRYMHGDLPVKDDAAVTANDVQTKNLILFGDPGSNRWIRAALPHLPIRWSHDELSIDDESLAAKDYAPALICPNPLPGAGEHYLVLNSGHTFHEKEFTVASYLLFPRLGDWAILSVNPGTDKWTPSAGEFPDQVVRAGLFDENWKQPVVASP